MIQLTPKQDRQFHKNLAKRIKTELKRHRIELHKQNCTPLNIAVTTAITAHYYIIIENKKNLWVRVRLQKDNIDVTARYSWKASEELKYTQIHVSDPQMIKKIVDIITQPHD